VTVGDGFSMLASDPARLSVAPTSYPELLKIDPSFNLAVENDAGGQLNLVAPYSATQFLVGGDFTRVAGNGNIRRLARFNSDGTLDPSFAPTSTGR